MWTHPGVQLAKHIPATFFLFNSATLRRSLKFWKLSVSALGLAACKRNYNSGLNKTEFCFLLT